MAKIVVVGLLKKICDFINIRHANPTNTFIPGIIDSSICNEDHLFNFLEEYVVLRSEGTFQYLRSPSSTRAMLVMHLDIKKELENDASAMHKLLYLTLPTITALSKVFRIIGTCSSSYPDYFNYHWSAHAVDSNQRYRKSTRYIPKALFDDTGDDAYWNEVVSGNETRIHIKVRDMLNIVIDGKTRSAYFKDWYVDYFKMLLKLMNVGTYQHP